MDAAESSIKTWLKFFMDASIPAGVATEYAISFSDNRMRLDMLPELSKDYLRDLNITVLGDVIAILKHAKAVSHQEYKTRKIDSSGGLSPSPSPPPPPVPAAKKLSALAASGESPASRMVKRLVRKEPPPPAAAGRLKRTADCLQDDSDDEMVGTKRRLVTSGRLGTPQTKTTAGSAGGKKTVFDRLGGGGGGGGGGSESVVTSTTPDSSTRFRITGLSGPAPAKRTSLHGADGSRARVTFLSDTARPSPPPARRGGLSYRGVLKTGASPASERSAVAAAAPKRKTIPVAGTLASDREAAAVSARSRIGRPASTAAGPARATGRTAPPASTAARAAEAGVRARLSRPTAPSGGGVKSRLGTGSGAGAGSVRSRLGTASR